MYLKRVSILMFLLVLSTFGDNSLSVREDSNFGKVVNGYIDEATLIITLDGAYAQQEMYIKYSDHGELGGHGGWSEVTHRFELPEKSTVTDMWLWIGDTISHALIMEVDKAQHDFDSITSQKIDPALLKVTDKQYDFNIYPLESGSFRKVKVSFIVPVEYAGTTPKIPLPVAFFSADNNSKTKLKILYNTDSDSTFFPVLLEDDSLVFKDRTDTLGITCKELTIEDVKAYSTLTLQSSIDFTGGAFVEFFKEDSTIYYSFGMYQKDFLGVSLDGSKLKKKLALGVDISGNYGLDNSFLTNILPQFLSDITTDGDSVSIYLSRGGELNVMPWTSTGSGFSQDVSTWINESSVNKELINLRLPKLLWADVQSGSHTSTTNWWFTDIDSLFDVDTSLSLEESCEILQEYDIVTSYTHGYCNNDHGIDMNAVDSFIRNGGTFVQFIDYNRTADSVANRYLDGFTLPTIEDNLGNTKIIRNDESELGLGFPESFYHMRANPIRHTDSNAVNALIDEYGNPVVVSKRIGNGTLILTGLWQINDDPSLKKTVAMAILGTHLKNKNFEMHTLLNKMGEALDSDVWDQTIILSNSAKIIHKDNLDEHIKMIKPDVLKKIPSLLCFNLLPTSVYSPPMCAIQNETFFGSGYLLSHIASEAEGVYLGAEYNTLDDIVEYLGAKFPKLTDISLDVNQRNRPIRNVIQISKNKINMDKPIFWTGVTNSSDSLEFVIKAVYEDSTKENSYILNCTDTSKVGTFLLKTAYYQNVLEKLLTASTLDTAKILELSIENRLLNDFTAFLALEDSLKKGQDEDDNEDDDKTSVLNNSLVVKELQVTHTIHANNKLSLNIHSPMNGIVHVSLFNLKGQLVTSLEEDVIHSELCKIGFENVLANGIYVVVVKVIDPNGINKSHRVIQRIVIK